MNGFSNQYNNNVKGISATTILWPIIIVLVILHAGIVFFILQINSNSSELSGTMKSSGEYISDATSLLAGSSLLSETSSNFVLMPKTKDGELNVQPLAAYANELGVDRRGDQVAKRFEKYKVSKQDKDFINKAAKCADNMLKSQLHAIALIDSVYKIPDTPALNDIPLPELSAKEKAYPNEKKLGTARSMILGSEYALNKQSVSTNVNACTSSIEEEAGKKAAASQQKIRMFRTLLWIFTFLIIASLVLAFVILFTNLIIPLEKFVRRIDSSNTLDEDKGLKEVRTVASAYNRLLKRRDALDSILRSAAETDSLTNLPNRYSFEQHLLESGEEGYSMAIVLFDVNYLKKTNDTKGHAAGDKLLQDSANCILACFGSSGDSKCFRFGGDEFAAVIKNTNIELIENMIEKFEKAQDRYDVSISCGYSYAEDISKTTIKDLMSEADKQMYKNKKDIHEQSSEE